MKHDARPLAALRGLAAAALVLVPAAALPAPAHAAPLGAAPQEVVADLLARGRERLIAGDAAGALELFQQANGLSNGALDTELWVLRAWMDAGRRNDAMARIEELEGKSAVPEHVSDYLRGSFAFSMAQELVTASARGGGGGGNAGFHYEDAKAFLASALAKEPELYADAWRSLASAARETRDGAAAERAIRGALKRFPEDPFSHALGAQILVANGVEGLQATAEDEKERGRALVTEGIALAERAAELFGGERKVASNIAETHLQRAVAQRWLDDKAAAAEAYAAAMEWDPTQVDFRELWGYFTGADGRPGPYVELLADGAQRFEKRWGKQIASDASLLWWLAFGEFTLGQYEKAEAHFVAAAEKFPAFKNSWWYAGLCRYFRQDYKGTVAHWRKNASDPASLVESVLADKDLNVDILEFVEGEMMKAGDPAAAAFVAGFHVNVTPTDARVWNNLGLFCRDAGDLLKRAGKKGDEHKTVEEYYERAWEAYSEANLREPNKPYYLNDAAVILHYCLERDYEKALEMYESATEIAERMLAQGGLTKDERELVEIALRDSKNNRADLVRRIERKKREKEKPGGGDGGGGS